MGQAASLQAAERCLETDFSSRLLLSHGLYRSPYPRGTYVLCEVDLTEEVLPKPGNEVPTELVVQVILLDEEATNGSSKSRSYGKLSESGIAQEKVGAPNGRVTLLDTTSKNKELSSPVYHKDEAASVRARGNSWVASSKTRVVQELLDKLAPGVSIEPASFEAILRDFQKYYSQNKGASGASGRVKNDGDRGSSIKSTSPQGGEVETLETLKSTNSRHPNIIHLLGAYKGECALYLLFPPAPFSLETVLHFSPSALGSEDHIRLLVFQMLSGLAHCHGLGVIHGNLRPWNVLLTDTLWCWISGFQKDLSQPQEEGKLQRLPSLSSAGDVLRTSEDVLSTKGGGFDLTGAGSNAQVEVESSCLNSLDDVSDFKGSSLLAEARRLDMSDWRGVFKRWWAGELSNYDYLLLLNTLAGRRWGDRCFHTVMPWVIDFSGRPDTGLSAGWRDLTKSKWRLAKGDEQLDFTYLSAEMPHHVSDECLSELAVCIYKARRLPLLVLRRIVRSVYEPNEYPSSMQRLYQWTPDECIPEFYSDTDVFRSSHQGMSNLAVPPWSHSAEEFISLHRAALESDRVSQQLHHWIDLIFGYKLSGQAAIDAKNVTLTSSGPTMPRSSGRRQLFSLPHPRRRDQYSLSSSLSGKEPVSTWRVRNKSFRQRLGTVKATGRVLRHVAEGKEAGTLKRASDHFRRIAPLEGLEEATFFCESARHLSPCYRPSSICSTISQSDLSENMPVEVTEEKVRNTLSPVLGIPSKTNAQVASWEMSLLDQKHSLALTWSGSPQQLATNLKSCKTEDDRNFENLVWWEAIRQGERQGSSGEGADMFAVACIIAELYLRKTIFDPVSMAAFRESGALPETLDQLPPAVLSLIKPPLDPDFSKRPSAKTLLKSPFFSTRVRAVYEFLVPLHSLGCGHHRLQYATTMAKLEAFQYLGPIATEMVAPFCLSLIVPPSSGHDPSMVVSLLRELLRALKLHASRRMLVPVIQQLLQDSSMSVTVLQPLFLREVLKILGIATHLEHFHSLVLANLRRSPDGRQEEAAAAVLISMCHDLGLPITLHQTLTPLLQSLGRDISVSGIDALVGIGERLGERVVVKHIVPAVRSILLSGLELSCQGMVGPAQSWRLLAMVDALAVLDRLILFLPPSTVLSELLQEPHNIYIRILSQPKLSSSLLQCAAKALLLVCQCVGSEDTAALVLPQLKPLFDAVAFNHEDSLGIPVSLVEKGSSSVSSRESQDNFQSLVEPEVTQVPTDSSMGKTPHSVNPDQIELVHTLYPGLAVLLGIQRLRQCLATWLLLEQALTKHFNWKWEGIRGGQVKSLERITLDLDTSSDFAADCNPANLLLDGVGWSIPQSQSQKWNKSSKSGRLSLDSTPEHSRISNAEATVRDDDEAWYWVPGKWENMGMSEAFAHSSGGLGLAKDEQPWELNSVILHSWQVHSGVVRATAVAEDENMVLTAGGGPKGGSVVRQWKLATSECSVEYSGHQEAVIDICLLPGRERVASCDGTLHIWSAQTGEQLACFDEASNSTSSTVITRLMSSPIEGGRLPNHVGGSLSRTSPSGSFNANFNRDNLYTCLHSMEAEERLVTGTVNGSLRFFDIVEGRRLHMWRCEPGESSMSYVSAIASSGQRKSQDLSTKKSLPTAWVAVGLSSGQCQLLDYRSGRVVVRWRAHDGSITKLDVLDEIYLVSSSVDKSISLWDLRRGVPSQLQTFRGHSDGVTSFTLKGADMLSAAGNKIGLSALCKCQQFGQERQVIQPQKLYTRRGARSLSQITSLSVLPFSRFFLVGTEDGFLKICT